MKFRKLPSYLLASALVMALLGLVFLTAAPGSMSEQFIEKPYTEFYVLGPGGTATDYPQNLSVGETGTVIVGINNYEHSTSEYFIEIATSEQQIATRHISINDEERWTDRVSFSFNTPGEKIVKLKLYKGSTVRAESYQDLYLRINVT